MRSVCFVDTCTLINLRGIKVARKDVRLWLWDEFDVVVSGAVAGEIRNHLEDMGPNGRIVSRKAERCTWTFGTRVSQYEDALKRILGHASIPEQTSIFDSKNIGELHNLLASIDAVRDSRPGAIRHVVFLSDDEKAKKFIDPVFQTFQTGCVWSSHDLMLYLFFRHRRRIGVDQAESVVRTLNAVASSGADNDKWTRKLHQYVQRLKAIDDFLANLP